MKLGDIIHNQRKRLSMTQIQLSSIAGTSQRTISDIESFNRIPSFDTVCKILDVLNLDITNTWLKTKSQNKEKANAFHK